MHLQQRYCFISVLNHESAVIIVLYIKNLSQSSNWYNTLGIKNIFEVINSHYVKLKGNIDDSSVGKESTYNPEDHGSIPG